MNAIANSSLLQKLQGNSTVNNTTDSSPGAYQRATMQVRLLTDSSTTEFPGDRLLVLRWKGKSDGSRVAHSARFVSVPAWQPELAGPDVAYLPMLVEAFEEQQKKMIHSAVSMVLDEGRECTALDTKDFTPSKVLEAWSNEGGSDENSSRGKLSKDIIGEWFDKKLKDVLELTLANKMGMGEEGVEITNEQLIQLERSTSNYRKVLGLLASPKPSVTIDQAKMLDKCVRLVEDAVGKDVVFSKLVAKLDGLINPVATDDLLMGL